MSVRIKELIRDCNQSITPADRHTMLDLIENLEAENKKLAHERAVYRAVLEGMELKDLEEMPKIDNAEVKAHAYGVTIANITKDILATLQRLATMDRMEKFAKLTTQGNA